VSAPAPAVRDGPLARLPLRVRLTAGLVLLTLIGLAVAGLAATSALRGYLLARVDQQLRQAASNPGARDLRGVEGAGSRGSLGGQLYVALLDGSGQVLQATPERAEPGGGPTGVPVLPAMSLTAVQARHRAPFTVDGSRGGSWRVVTLALPATGGSVVFAADLREVDQTVGRLVLLQLVIGGLVLLGVSGLGFVVVRSSLRGLVEVEEAAAAVSAGDLDRRVPGNPHTEIGSLATSFNEMVSQVQNAFATRTASEQRLRRFVADASHELRTPLTSIRGFAELHRQGAVTEPAQVSRLLGRIEGEATRMGVLVEDLLALARLDEQRPLRLTEVDLGVLAADAVQAARAVEPDRPITVHGTAPTISADEARLRQVLGNLLSNALQHTPAGTPIQVRMSASTDGNQAVVEVADSGPGMDAEVAARVFERFFRADASRTRSSGGTGLGLSIVAALVHAHGGRVELDTAPGRGATFKVHLPAAGPPQTPDVTGLSDPAT